MKENTKFLTTKSEGTNLVASIELVSLGIDFWSTNSGNSSLFIDFVRILINGLRFIIKKELIYGFAGPAEYTGNKANPVKDPKFQQTLAESIYNL